MNISRAPSLATPLLVRLSAVVLACAGVVSCTGYQLGGSKPSKLEGIESIHVPMFANRTLEPRAEVLATNATVAALADDGRYQLAGPDAADAVLEGRVAGIDYAKIRGQRFDTLRPLELQNDVTIEWSLRRANRPAEVLDRGLAIGSSRFFLGANANLQTSRTNALPDAIQNAARKIATRLGSGF